MTDDAKMAVMTDSRGFAVAAALEVGAAVGDLASAIAVQDTALVMKGRLNNALNRLRQADDEIMRAIANLERLQQQ